jgi:cytochrome c oxidase subunit I
MSSAAPEMVSSAGAPASQPVHYLNAGFGVRSWLMSTDHKRIAILYLISVTVMFFLGGLPIVLVRFQLLTPKNELLDADTYNKMFTMHGVVMIFFFMIPAIPAVLGNFLVPMMLGAKDLAFPRINLISWYCYLVGGALGLYAIINGGVDTGWTFYVPFSSKAAHTNVLPVALGAFVAGFSSILTGLNFLVTTHQMRAPGLTWMRLPLFIWSMYATSIIMLLGTPVVAIAIVLVGLERIFGVGVFDPAIGGDPLLFQHLFWFYSHPAVYIMILPAMGVVSEIIPCFARKNIYGYKFIAFSSVAIALLGFLVWGHHMFVAGQSVYEGMIFSFLSFLVAVPSSVKVFNWTSTLYKGSVSFTTPMLFAFGFIGMFTIGGLTGMYLACLGTDVHLHDTYFVVAHFHFIMVGGTVMAYLGGLHYWWPKMTGRMYPEFWGRISAALIFVGFALTFLPQFAVGNLGMPRRYYQYAPEYQVYNVFSTAGASILGVGYVIPLIYLLGSLGFGAKARDNPWKSTGLEWRTSTPPPPDNFPEVPVVTKPPYQYHEEAANGD